MSTVNVRRSHSVRSTWLGLGLMVGLGCASRSLEQYPERWPAPPPRELTLGQTVTDSTDVPDGRSGAICTGGGIVGRFSAHAWRFVAPAPASYRFHIQATHRPAVEIRSVPSAPERSSTCFEGPAGVEVSSSVALNPGAYDVIVDGHLQARGRYSLRVEQDLSETAEIRPEEPSRVEALCGAAPRLGVEPALGVFESIAGGARAGCGGTGGGAVYRLDLPAPSRVQLAAAAQFKVALEVRAACQGPALACTASTGPEATLEASLEAGTYYIVLDSAEVGPPALRLPGARIRGAYQLQAVRSAP